MLIVGRRQVASNYESSVREIVDGLLEISDATREVAELSCLFHRDEIQKHVVLFYADILTFCWYALEWYNSKSWSNITHIQSAVTSPRYLTAFRSETGQKLP